MRFLAHLCLMGLISVQCNWAIAHSIPEHSKSAHQMTETAQELLKNLSKPQIQQILYKFEDNANRTYWTNAPVDSQSRNGLPIGRLSLAQRVLLHKLLISSTSTQGYHKLWGAVRGDDALKTEGDNRELNSEKFFNKNQSLGAINYWLSFYGDPRIQNSWGYMITGHHLAANFTIVDGKSTFLPMFYGSDPAHISTGAHAGHVFLPQERNRGAELLNSLNSKQKKVAIVSADIPSNKFGPKDFMGPGKKDSNPAFRGLAMSQMNPAQRKLLWVLIEEYVGNADFDVAETQLHKIRKDGEDNLYFMWMGAEDASGRIFYRVHGPSILIDFVDQRTGFDWNTHPHTIVRDPSNDYGEDWLDKHISEHHTHGQRPEKL